MLHRLIVLQYKNKEECGKECTRDGWWCEKAYNAAGQSAISCCHCFPASAKIFLENGKSVTMSELQIGDAVKSGELTILLK